MRVTVADPPAYTPPYDHALCEALADRGLDVTLATSHFRFGEVPLPRGYRRVECFYRLAPGSAAAKALQHPLDMTRLARRLRADGTDVVHFQWLPIPNLDRHLLGRFPRPVVLTAHDVTPREVRPGARGGTAAVLRAVDAVIVHSQAGAQRVVEEAQVPPSRVHVIPHGAFAHLARMSLGPPPDALAGLEGRRVVLFFGLVRPYKGVDLLVEALAGTPADVVLLIVGMPRMSLAPLEQRAEQLGIADRVRFVPRFVPDSDVPAYFRRADVTVLPYREIEQSGVLYTALAFGTPMLLSAVGGFPEIAERGAARLVEPGSVESLRTELAGLLADQAARAALSQAALALAADHSWERTAALTEDLYRKLLGGAAGVTVVAVVFWVSIALIVFTHVGYALLLRALLALRSPGKAVESSAPPSVSLIVAAHNEGDVIEEKVRNMRALEYPGRLELIVASDGSTDQTVHRSRDAMVLDLPRQGKVHAQDAAVDVATGEILAFSDANAFWDPDALRELVRPFADPTVGYVCGQLSYLAPDGSNQEGAYWRYENWVRALESRIGSVTAGNGAIYAVRRAAYMRLDPRTSHDLSFPFNMVKQGWRALYEPAARATERPVPSIEGEFRRKRRMMSHAWPAVLSGGMLNPRGYGLTYGLEILSHRVLRYATPFLHVVAFAANVVLLDEGWVYKVTLAGQLALLLAAGLAPLNRRSRILALCRYYVLMTASLAAGLWDSLRHGTPATWERAPERPS